MSAIWQHKIVFAIQMDPDIITPWFGLDPVDGIRKNSNGSLTVYLKDVVIMGLQRSGLSLTGAGKWLCCDEENRWWVLEPDEYASLGPDRHVILLPNEKTQKQFLALKTIEKMKRDFEAMSEEEQQELYKMYPDFFIKDDK